MKFLDFDGRSDHSERIRAAGFRARSALPVSAACVVANGVRETLTTLLGAPAGMRLFEPCIPSPQAWHALLQEARMYRVRGSVADVAVILRASDAAALAAMLFGEAQIAPLRERPLSRLECDVLDRMVNAIAANLGSVCGARDHHVVERVGSIAGFATYFELLVTEPLPARIGIALSRDPVPERGATLDIALLSRVSVTVEGMLDFGPSDFAHVVGIEPGSFLKIPQGRAECVLRAAGRPISRGACGVRNGRYAVAIDGRA